MKGGLIHCRRKEGIFLKEKLTKKNQSVEKVFQIIECMAENRGPMRLQDIATQVQYPASTSLRLLNTLVSFGYVKQDPETSKYSLSLKFCRIGEAARSQFSIRDIVRPYLVELSERCQESACLAIEQDMTVVYLDVAEGPDKMLRTLQRIGKVAPLHSTGVGKLLLTNYSRTELEALTDRKQLIPLTPNTITSLEGLVEELERVKKQGYALDNEECELGARCVAAPLKDYSGRTVACISVSGPISRMTMERVPAIFEVLQDISRRVSAQLGYTGG